RVRRSCPRPTSRSISMSVDLPWPRLACHRKLPHKNTEEHRETQKNTKEQKQRISVGIFCGLLCFSVAPSVVHHEGPQHVAGTDDSPQPPRSVPPRPCGLSPGS